jgi:hemerythrin superfamily protein
VSLTDFFEQDHRDIEVFFRAALDDARAGSSGSARVHFDEFSRALDRHIEWEEALLFPEFEHATGMVNVGPTAVMRAEHREIRRFKGLIREALVSLEGAAGPNHLLWKRVDDLVHVLTAHNVKEQEILYPQCDRLIGADDRRRILRTVFESKGVRV